MSHKKLTLKIRFHLKSKSKIQSLLLVHFNFAYTSNHEMQNWSPSQIDDWLKNQTKLKQSYHPVKISTGLKVITSNWNQTLQLVAGNLDVNTRLNYIKDLGKKIFDELLQINDVIISHAEFKRLFNLRYVASNDITQESVVKTRVKKVKEYDPALLPDGVTLADVRRAENKSKIQGRTYQIENMIFTTYWTEKIDYWVADKTIDIDSRRNYISTINCWKHFERDLHSGKQFMVHELDKYLIREFAIYLTTKKSKRKKFIEEFEGIRLGTISKHKGRLKTILKELQVEDEVDLSINTNVKILAKRTEKTEDVALSEEEIRKVYRADFSDLDNPVGYRGSDDFKTFNEELEFYRSCFLLGIIAGGCRVSDLKQIKDIRPIVNGGYKLFYRSDKTDFDVELKLPEFFPIIYQKVKDKLSLIDEVRFNKLLRIIGLHAGLTDEIYLHITNPATNKTQSIKKPIYALLVTHTARRTFISLSYEKGMKPQDIMDLTGITSMATLEFYIKKKRRTIQLEAIDFG